MRIQVAAPAVSWHGFARSVRGASHVRRGAPNQDAGETVPLAGGSGIVLAVADGHGDKLHARSERGSRFAVAIALELVGRWIDEAINTSPPTLTMSLAALKERLIDNWRAAVDADLAADPPSSPGAPVVASSDEPDDMRVLYGTTLIVAALTTTCAVYAQIGDGDLLAVTEDGNARWVFPAEATDLPLNRTDSLCQRDAIERLRICVEPFADVPAPVLVLLSTDGYANSFSDGGAFLQVALDLKNYVASRGLAWVTEQVETWLTETSAQGSGDDITLALAWYGAPIPATAECEPPVVDESRQYRRWPGAGRPRVVSKQWTRRKFASAVTSGIALAMLIVALANVLAPSRFGDTAAEPGPTPVVGPTVTPPPLPDLPSWQP